MDTYTIAGMTCAGCARKVEATLKKFAPDAIVTLDPPQASLSGASVATINDALSKVGKYRATLRDAVPVSVNPFTVYYPLFLVLALIGLAAFANANWMQNFMAGFFIVFGAFKLFDVSNFAQAYGRYDVIAKIFKPWGLAFPFVETALGFAFLFSFHLAIILWVALLLSLIGAVGVVQSVLNKQSIQCACLGTVFQLPMSTITIVENLGMAVMATWMILR